MNSAYLAIIKHIAVVAAFAAVAAGASAAGLVLGTLDPTVAAVIGGGITLFVRLVNTELTKIDPTAVPAAK